MDATARETYLETEVATATPQRLRLMLLDAALRWARQAQAAIRDARGEDAADALARCREVVGELIAGVHPDASPLAQTVLGLYAFLHRALTEVGQTRDLAQLAGVIGVLEEERTTWLQLCQQMPDRPAAALAPTGPVEEVAPAFAPQPASVGFSIEA